MSQDSPLPHSTTECMAHAASDLRLAQLGSGQEDVLPGQVCFHALQAAEKALKAVLVGRGIDFPLTHDLQQLLELCAEARVGAPSAIAEVDRLTPYAVETRYPGHSGEISPGEVEEALALAQATVAWARGALRE